MGSSLSFYVLFLVAMWSGNPEIHSEVIETKKECMAKKELMEERAKLPEFKDKLQIIQLQCREYTLS